MGTEDMKLAGLQNVTFAHVPFQKLMEIADPAPELYHRLDLAQLTKVMRLGLAYQNKLITVEMNRLKVQQDAIAEFEKLLEGFGR